MSAPVQIMLDAEAYARLVNGEIVEFKDKEGGAVIARVALSDIGWDRMHRLIDAAERRHLGKK